MGKCICDPTTAGPSCAFCIVPGSCGNPLGGTRANLKACADFGKRRQYGRAYNFVKDPVTGLGRCECNPQSTPHCAACLFPGVCKFCNAPFELVDGKCGESPAHSPPNRQQHMSSGSMKSRVTAVIGPSGNAFLEMAFVSLAGQEVSETTCIPESRFHSCFIISA